jgi:uncharacterized damage-inducible protein DinB
MPVPGVRSVAGTLAHVAIATRWPIEVHSKGIDFIDFTSFGAHIAQMMADEQRLRGKDEILQVLRSEGDAFAAFLESLTDAKLAETVGFPPPVQPSVKTRFEMLLSIKEHEMHHRGQLMLMERLLGMVPHLTRQYEAMAAALPAAKA